MENYNTFSIYRDSNLNSHFRKVLSLDNLQKWEIITFARVAILDLQVWFKLKIGHFKELIKFETLYSQNKNVFREPWTGNTSGIQEFQVYLPKMPM